MFTQLYQSDEQAFNLNLAVFKVLLDLVSSSLVCFIVGLINLANCLVIFGGESCKVREKLLKV